MGVVNVTGILPWTPHILLSVLFKPKNGVQKCLEDTFDRQTMVMTIAVVYATTTVTGRHRRRNVPRPILWTLRM